MKKLDLEKVKEISNLKKEPKWMCDFRINAYKKFIQLKNPTFGPKIKLDFDIINYYKKVLKICKYLCFFNMEISRFVLF